MNVLVIGANGQLGRELVRQLGEAATSATRPTIDLTIPETIEELLDQSRFEIVINTAAYNLVDQAEDEPDLAYQVNALGARNLARACSARNLTLVHVSTDYVFGLDASDKPRKESDPPGPLGAYAVSKLAGEYYVRSLCSKHFVVRTCGLYGHLGRTGIGKGNFVETMLQLANERDELRVVNDQHCTPSSVKDIAAAIIRLSEVDQYGLYHATNSGATTWAELATEILQYTKSSTRVIPIPSTEYPTKARRPGSSVLDCSKIQNTVGYSLRDWKHALHDYLDERGECSLNDAT